MLKPLGFKSKKLLLPENSGAGLLYGPCAQESLNRLYF